MARVRKEQVALASEETAPEAAVSFEDFLKEHGKSYNPGLIASFTYEAKLAGGLEPKSTKAWAIAFEEQSKRVY